MFPPLLALLIGAAVAAALTWPVRALAFKIGAVAHPGGRRIHQQPTAQAGGLAIYAGFWVALLALTWPLQPPFTGILLGSGLLLVMCLADDIKNLSPWLRLLGQFLVALIAFAGGVAVHGLTNPLSAFTGTYHYLSLGWWSAPLTIIWIMAITNALNWLDGLDGLVAGVAALAGLTIMIGAGSTGIPAVAIAAGALAGGCLGFLPFNFNPAKIFMGDTGAMFLGYMLACIAVIGPFKIATAVAILVPLLVLGVPIFDTVTGIIRRLAAGKSPLAADRGHIHHRLIDRGFSVRQAVLFIYSLTAMLCVVALVLWRWRVGG
ncbi:MAG: undecaprenyl/decaprenyl-phosphate alpha-N-acetylglucosaminyl 1-phosphate transferase [Armatimonadetes bacterium]|nr:undecaprenyl/decaprenyl-phosphate alpha-N-acetylglucosaminyl 1-phosphate transferase [Armatimonadota bacterium]